MSSLSNVWCSRQGGAFNDGQRLPHVQQSSRDSQYELIERYAPLVKRIAYHLLARLPASVQVDDPIQAGMIGLLEVPGKYDASKGASFETYAGIRIRGAMLDEVRKGDWHRARCTAIRAWSVTLSG